MQSGVTEIHDSQGEGRGVGRLGLSDTYRLARPGAVVAWRVGTEWMAVRVIGLSAESDDAIYICANQSDRKCDFASCDAKCENFFLVALGDHVVFEERLKEMADRQPDFITATLYGLSRYREAKGLLQLIQQFRAEHG
jgi:hypothetical protein